MGNQSKCVLMFTMLQESAKPTFTPPATLTSTPTHVLTCLESKLSPQMESLTLEQEVETRLQTDSSVFSLFLSFFLDHTLTTSRPSLTVEKSTFLIKLPREDLLDQVYKNMIT